jgi:predicted TIM-barrel fold metal-dependent hydrolase
MDKDLQNILPVNDFVLEFEYDLDQMSEKIHEVSGRLNHQRLWELVLERYPNLKLDLAHWGGESAEWRSLISEMLRKYPNLYTDLACTEEKFFTEQVSELNDPSKEFLHEKVLYGSDYHILMLFSDSIDSYLKMFFSNLPKTLWDKISITNPKSFFG